VVFPQPATWKGTSIDLGLTAYRFRDKDPYSLEPQSWVLDSEVARGSVPIQSAHEAPVCRRGHPAHPARGARARSGLARRQGRLRPLRALGDGGRTRARQLGQRPLRGRERRPDDSQHGDDRQQISHGCQRQQELGEWAAAIADDHREPEGAGAPGGTQQPEREKGRPVAQQKSGGIAHDPPDFSCRFPHSGRVCPARDRPVPEGMPWSPAYTSGAGPPPEGWSSRRSPQRSMDTLISQPTPESRPAAPSQRSVPMPPSSASLPAPPVSRSLPASPLSRSLPSKVEMMSSPRPP